MFKPANDYIFIRKAKSEDAGVIALPDTVKESLEQKADVLAVGPGRFSEEGALVPMPHVQVGDRILVHLLHGGAVPVEHKMNEQDQVYAIRGRDILAIEE